jgi:hypothetical protein
MVTGILYLILDEMIGDKKYISRFIANTIPGGSNYALANAITGADPNAVIMETPEGDPVTVEEFQKALEGQHI